MRLGPRGVALDCRRSEEAERLRGNFHSHGSMDHGVKADAKDPVGFLRRLVELGADEKSCMDCRVTLPTRGEDLKFSHTTSKEDPRVKLGEVWSKCSFEILEPSKGSTKEGSFTCSA